MKKVGVLRSLASLAVVVGHSAGFALMLLAWWAPRFGGGEVAPDWRWVGTADYYGLAGLNLLALVSVPLFLVASGFYVNYASGNGSTAPSWRMMRGWITALLYPFLVWMCIATLLRILTAGPGPLGGNLDLIDAIRRSAAWYYYVPLMVQLFLLCPLLIRLAAKHPVWLLGGSLLMEGLYVAPHYYISQAGVAGLEWLVNLDYWGSPLPWHWGFFFSLGLVAARYRGWVRRRLARFRWHFVVGAALFWLLSIAETDLLNRSAQRFSTVDDWKLTTTLYSAAAAMALLSWEWDRGSVVRALDRLGAKSYGIYLVQPIAIEWTAKVIYHVAPDLLPQQWLLQPLLISTGLGIPLLLMAAASRLPTRRYHRQIFGSYADRRGMASTTARAPSSSTASGSSSRLAIEFRLPSLDTTDTARSPSRVVHVKGASHVRDC